MVSERATDHVEEPEPETADSEPEPTVETARRQLQQAAERLDIDPNIVERLNYRSNFQ